MSWTSFKLQPSKHFCFPRSLQDVFSVTLFVFQDILKTSSRHLQDVFVIRLPKMSSRRFQEVFKTPSRRLQDVFAKLLPVMSSRRLGRQKNVSLKTSSRRLQYVFAKTNICFEHGFVNLVVIFCFYYVRNHLWCYCKPASWLKKQNCYFYSSYYNKEGNNEHLYFLLCICCLWNSRFDFLGYLFCTTLKTTT